MDLLSSRRVYASPWFDVREDVVRGPDGRTADHALVEGPDMAIVLALDGDRVHLVRQHRHPLGDRTWELPSGSAEPDDADPVAVGRRELRQETGLSAAAVRRLGVLAVWPSTTGQRCHVLLATGLTAGAPSPDPDPDEGDLEARSFSRAEVEAMIVDGTLRDARSVAAYGMLLVRERATRGSL